MVYRNLLGKLKYPVIVWLVLCCVGPLILLAVQSIISGITNDVDIIKFVIPHGRTLKLFAKSALWALCVSMFCVVVALPASVLLWQQRSGKFSRLRWLVVGAFLIPSYVQAAAWEMGLLKIKQIFGLTKIPLAGWGISWWVQGMYLLPLAVGLLTSALELTDDEMVAAARILNTDEKVWQVILRPLIKPAIYATGIIVFMLSWVDYTIPSLFGVNSYALEIMAEFSSTHSVVNAFLLALPLILMQIMLLLVLFRQFRKMRYLFRQAANYIYKLNFSLPRRMVQRVAMAIILAIIIVPMFTILLNPAVFQEFVPVINLAKDEVLNTFAINALAVLLIGLFTIAVVMFLFSLPSLKWLWPLVLFPLVMPPSLVGISLINFWHSLLPRSLYSSVLIPVLAIVMRFSPIMLLIMAIGMATIPEVEIEAATVIAKRIPIWRRIIIPRMLPTIIMGMVLVFILGSSDLGATLLVVPPGTTTLTITIYNYLHYGANTKVAALCLIVLLITLVPASLLIYWWQQRKAYHD